MKRLIPSLLLTLCYAGAAFAAGPPSALPPGMGKYIMVLWPPGTPVPGEGPVGTMKNVPEPDIEHLGGKVLAKFDNRRVIQLPLAAAVELRRHEAVAFLQRVWTGESFDGWDERYVPAPAKGHLHVAPQDDTNLSWGPKSYTYDGSGNIKAIGADSFAYDSAGRLIQATVNTTIDGAAVAKTESYKYDAFGNLFERAVSGMNAVAIPVDAGSNRIQGASYDAAGNVTTSKDGRWSYEYDSLNMLMRVQDVHSFAATRMIYDANDERIGTFLIGEDSARWTFRDFQGRVLREYTSYKNGTDFQGWTWQNDYFYGENGLIGGETNDWSYDGNYGYGGRRHYHLDHLGNVRMVTTDATTTTRARSISEHDYYPFGTTMTRTYQEPLNWADPHIDAMRFAGHWRDFLGGLNVDNTDYIDYMHARHYDPNSGRFLSVDPVTGTPDAPQSWNRYAYVLNNPLRFADPNGLQCVSVTISGVGTRTTCDDDGRTRAAAEQNSALREAELREQAKQSSDEHNIVYRYLMWGHKHLGPAFDKFSEINCRYSILSNCHGVKGGAVVIGPLVGVGAAEDIVVTFSEQEGVAHGFRHIAETGIAEADARATIARAVQSSMRGATSAPGSDFWGKVVINGQQILYKAHVMADGSVNVGTFWSF